MTNMEAAGIASGLGALGLAKQLRRINEQKSPKAAAKMGVMQNAMKAAAAQGVNPKEALKSMKGKV